MRKFITFIIAMGMFSYTCYAKNMAGAIYAIALHEMSNNTPVDSVLVNITKTNVTCYGFCDGAATVNDAEGCSYIWDTYGGGWGYATTKTVSSLCPGVYTVTVTNGNVYTKVLSVTVIQPAALAINATVTGSTGINGTATINVTGGTAPYNYTWSNNKTTATVTGLTAGTYYINVQDGHGCIANATAVVNKTNGISQPKISKQQITMWPNPVTDGFFHIEGAKNTQNIELYDILGKRVLQSKATETIDVTGLVNGIYFIHINNTLMEESIVVKKIIIQHN